MPELKVGKLAVIDGPFTVGVWVDEQPCAKFIKLDDADTFAVAKRQELRAQEDRKLADENKCQICQLPMGDSPFLYHEVCPTE